MLERSKSICEIAGLSVGVQFALSPNAMLVAVPLASLEQIILDLCTAARAQLMPGGRIVVETRGVNDASVGAASAIMQPADARARVVVRAERLAPEPTRRVDAPAQTELAFSALEQTLQRLGGRLEVVPLSEDDFAYVAHLPHAVGTDSSGRMAVAIPEQSGVIPVDRRRAASASRDGPHPARVWLSGDHRAQTSAARSCKPNSMARQSAWSSRIWCCLVVSDLVLPGVSGKDLVRRLRQPCEHARVLYISGYSPEHVGALTDGARFLRKPFTAQELLALVRELLPEMVVAR